MNPNDNLSCLHRPQELHFHRLLSRPNDPSVPFLAFTATGVTSGTTVGPAHADHLNGMHTPRVETVRIKPTQDLILSTNHPSYKFPFNVDFQISSSILPNTPLISIVIYAFPSRFFAVLACILIYSGSVLPPNARWGKSPSTIVLSGGHDLPRVSNYIGDDGASSSSSTSMARWICHSFCTLRVRTLASHRSIKGAADSFFPFYLLQIKRVHLRNLRDLRNLRNLRNLSNLHSLHHIKIPPNLHRAAIISLGLLSNTFTSGRQRTLIQQT